MWLAPPWAMKKLIVAVPLLLVAAVACSDDDRDDIKRDVDRNEPAECTARCSEAKDECVTACIDDDDCVTGCTDEARDCEVDCD
jgi:hypothetical protein